MMLTSVYMMVDVQAASGLAPRLERLTGIDADCCVSEYEGLSEKITRAPAFTAALHRARALADEHRLTAVALLRRHRELCACEIQAALGVSHATVSHHMAVLTDAGVVASRRKGKWTYYRLVSRAGIEIP
jgi:biotin operon repressor